MDKIQTVELTELDELTTPEELTESANEAQAGADDDDASIVEEAASRLDDEERAEANEMAA